MCNRATPGDREKIVNRFDRPWPAGDVSVHRTEVLWKDGGSTVPDFPDEAI